jgi:sigma-B regulation protein RsbU (phosphoserine phosphatase)
VLGLLNDSNYEQVSMAVEAGSLLVAYSDGITEAANSSGEEFGAERLKVEVLRNGQAAPGQLCDLLIDTVKKWCAPAEPFDDQTVVVARIG